MPPTAVPQATPSLRLNVFDGDPLLRFLDSKGVHARTLLILVPLTLILLFIASASSVRLLSPDAWATTLCHDLGRFFLSPNWGCLKGPAPAPIFPLTRDFPSVPTSLIVAVTPYLIYSQWQADRDLYVLMIGSKTVQYENSAAEQTFEARLQKVNQYFGRAGRLTCLTAAVATFSLLLVVAAQRRGIYAFQAPVSMTDTQKADWALAAYRSWWAGFDSNIAGWITYFMLGFVGIYYITTMNIIGGRIVIFVWQTRKLLVYGADADNQDGYYGWLPARGILAPTYKAIALHGIGLFLVASMLAPPSILLLIPVLGQWLIVLIPYILVPIHITRRGILAFQAREIAQINARVAQLRALPSTAELEIQCQAWAQRLKSIRDIRSLPFRRKNDLLLLAFVLISGAASIYSVLSMWYTRS